MGRIQNTEKEIKALEEEKALLMDEIDVMPENWEELIEQRKHIDVRLHTLRQKLHNLRNNKPVLGYSDEMNIKINNPQK